MAPIAEAEIAALGARILTSAEICLERVAARQDGLTQASVASRRVNFGGIMQHGSYPTTAKNYLRRNAGCRHPRPSDLLLRLSLQPLDSDQRGPVGRRRQAVRSRATICLQGLRQERCRRPARFRLQQEGAGR